MITSELLNDKNCTIRLSFKDLEELGHSSVTDYCRDLVKNFGYQKGTLENSKIEVYRGDMLCLTVSDIKEAAKLEPIGSGWTAYRPPEVRRRFKRPRTGATEV